MNKKILSKGKLKQGVICLGDILLQTVFPTTDITLSHLSLIMTRSHVAQWYEKPEQHYQQRDLHSTSWWLLHLPSTQQDTNPGAGTFLPYEHRAAGSLIFPTKTTCTEKWHKLWLAPRDSWHNDIPSCFSRVHRTDSLTSSCANATHFPTTGVQHRDRGPIASGDKAGWAAQSHGACDACPQSQQQWRQNPEKELRSGTLHDRLQATCMCSQTLIHK